MKPAIVMQTDFTKGVATNTMDGVIFGIDPEIKTFDSCHTITPFNVFEASVALDFVVPFWPKGTIFVSVVDPGVGTSRRASVAKLKNGSYVVTPDNGTLTLMVKTIGVEAIREIDETKNRLESTKAVSIFHGRDLFAYCAGKLAAGLIDFEGVGPEYPVDEIVMYEEVEPFVKDNVLTGMIERSNKGFGLVSSNIPYAMFDKIKVKHGDFIRCTVTHNDETIFEETVKYVPSFGHVSIGEPLVMVSETQKILLAKNQRDIATEYGIAAGPDWKISFLKI